MILCDAASHTRLRSFKSFVFITVETWFCFAWNRDMTQKHPFTSFLKFQLTLSSGPNSFFLIIKFHVVHIDGISALKYQSIYYETLKPDPTLMIENRKNHKSCCITLSLTFPLLAINSKISSRLAKGIVTIYSQTT